MFKEAKVGDRVWSIKYGWGVIEETEDSEMYPIAVGFKNDKTYTYTHDGKAIKEDINHTLFWDEIKIEAPEKPLPELEVDTKVLVWDYKGDYKKKRYFSHFSENGKMLYCFPDGKTSFTVHHSDLLRSWRYWELHKEDNS